MAVLLPDRLQLFDDQAFGVRGHRFLDLDAMIAQRLHGIGGDRKNQIASGRLTPLGGRGVSFDRRSLVLVLVLILVAIGYPISTPIG